MGTATELFTELHGEAALEEKTKEEAEEGEEPECEATKQDEQIMMAKQLSKIVLEEQITKIKLRLSDIHKKIESMKYSMPSNEKSDQCIQKTDCAACTKENKCGWCAMEQRCVAGDNVGPMYTMCNFYNYLYCSGDCARYVDCESCTKDTACAWCEDQAHMVIGCVLVESDGAQCPPDYLIGDGTDSCPKRKIEIVRTVSDRKKKTKTVKAEEPNNKSSERGWQDNYVMVRQGRYKERMESLSKNGGGVGQAASQSELDNLYQEQYDLKQKLKKYEKQYKKLVAEDPDAEEEGEE